MLAGELAAVIHAGFQVPVLVVIRGFAVAQRGLAAADHRDVGAVEGRVGHVQAGAVGPGGVLDGLVVAAGTGALLGERHIRVVTAFHRGAEALGDEVQPLGDGHVHPEGGLVLGLVAGPVVVLPAVPFRKAVRKGVVGDHRHRHAVHDARRGRRMGPQHGEHPDVAAVAVQRFAGVADHAADVELHVRRLGELEVQVRAVVVPVVGVVVVVGDVRDLLQQTVLEHVAHRHEVADLVRAARDVDVVLGLEEGLAEHQLVPLRVREHDGVAARAVGLDGLRREVQALVGLAVVPLVHVVVPGEIIAGALRDVGHRNLRARDGTHGDLGFPRIAALGGDDDDAVRAADTEHGRGCRILEDRETLDFVRIHRVHRPFHAIHEDERGGVGVGQGTHASDVDPGIVFTRLSGFLDGGHAGHLAGEDVRDVGNRGLDEGLVVDGSERTGDGRLGLRTVRHHDRRLDGLRIVAEHHGQRALFPHRHLLGDIAQGLHFEDGVLTRYGQGEASVHVGSHTGGRSLQGDARTDHRQAVPVHDITFHGNAPVLRGGKGPRQSQQAQDSSQSCEMDYFVFHGLVLVD